MSEETEARARVHDQFGSALASKASDAFCLALTRPGMRAIAAMETVTEPPPVLPAIVELTPGLPEWVQAAREALETVRQTKAWPGLRRALVRTKDVMPAAGIQMAHLLRHALVAAVRDEAYQAVNAISDEIERSARGFQRAGPETMAVPGPPAALTEICWLNRTIRTWVDPRSLVEVVADSQVALVDLPRRLEPDIQVSGKTVGAPAHRKRFKRTGRGVILAVIDTEVALHHPALQGRVIHKQNYSREPWGHPGGHGTAVAGIAAASGEPFLGMAPEATIYNYKVLATNRFLNADDFGGALAIQQALEDGAHVANCSWGAGPARDGTSREARACDTAWALGLTIVKSAGNRGPGSGTLTTPADAEGVIVVGATDREGTSVQDYSSRGPTLHGKARPHLLAPGGSVHRGIDSCRVEGGFADCGRGTSFAAPHAAGLLALILEGAPDLTPDEQRDTILGLCTAFEPNDANVHGAGLVSLANQR